MGEEHVKETVSAQALGEGDHSVGHVHDEPVSGIDLEPFRMHRPYPRLSI
jgi:hypothetical protein